jgi:hypothetical protein
MGMVMAASEQPKLAQHCAMGACSKMQHTNVVCSRLNFLNLLYCDSWQLVL